MKFVITLIIIIATVVLSTFVFGPIIIEGLVWLLSGAGFLLKMLGKVLF